MMPSRFLLANVQYLFFIPPHTVGYVVSKITKLVPNPGTNISGLSKQTALTNISLSNSRVVAASEVEKLRGKPAEL